MEEEEGDMERGERQQTSTRGKLLKCVVYVQYLEEWVNQSVSGLSITSGQIRLGQGSEGQGLHARLTVTYMQL